MDATSQAGFYAGAYHSTASSQFGIRCTARFLAQGLGNGLHVVFAGTRVYRVDDRLSVVHI